MNFMDGTRQSEGLYEEDSSRGTHPAFTNFSSSPSASSNQQQQQQQMIGRLVPLSRGPWDDETTASFRGGGVGVAGPSHQLDLMMMDSSSSPTKDNNDLVLDSPSGGGAGGGGGSTSSLAAAEMIEKEHMFDKVVTPSDVGKLNRLVIPKQQAEKYFPLDSSTNDKGLLLNFEDRNGKAWRFRYSYWNSSQSYVMTKGWSRFVKEKKLDAGDMVSFLRGVGELGRDRLFIDWRRRPDATDLHRRFPHQFSFNYPPWNHQPLYLQQQQHHQIPWGNFRLGSGPIMYSRSPRPQQLGFGLNQRGNGVEDQPVVYESVPVVVEGKAAGKRLRLFGVNMDCPMSESEEDHYCIGVPSTTVSHSTMPSQQYVPHLEFRPSNYGNPIIQTTMPSQSHLNNKGKTSMSSLDLNI